QLLFMGQEFAQGAEWSQERGLDWGLLDAAHPARADHHGVRRLVRDLNDRYRCAPALWEQDTVPAGFSWVAVDAAQDDVVAFLRFAKDGTPLLVVCHFSPVVRHGYPLRVPAAASAWEEILNTDAECYGGGGVRNTGVLEPEDSGGCLRVTLPPLATVWLRPV
ncbi:alpha amylase C-terminal domain-containing protein, partial [Streptomyces silvensis]|uniref:alpha amylase C-terminal domain-containing protein n=1 Tax=Streptomyces silvensis TaxID=1765722 RepID=UPI001F5220EE